jgi:membrane-associated protein
MFLIASALDSQLSDLLAASGPFLFYIAVWGLIFTGSGLLIGAVPPLNVLTGDSLLFAAGLITAGSNDINVVILAVGVGVFAFLGDQVGFVLGRHFGRPYLDRRKGVSIKRAVAKTEAFYQKWGWFAVVIARFIPVVRTLIPVVAGIGRMNYYKFLSANFTGAIVWGTGMTFVGYWAATIPAVKNLAYVIGFGFIFASLFVAYRSWRREKNLNALEENL